MGAGETQLRRLRMRSMRRGIKEMDVILMHFSNVRLAQLDPPMIDLYERMLEENDHDLYAWVAGTAETPEVYAALIDEIQATLPQR
ncbi:FAD assembly factor SdhE [Pseudaestuariivita sp.]|uniref:FAD assembly factor SdhE n=1 Tax=Pseudaestuariivita sp. TaxID=2211669 RepID=UPI00405A36E4